MVFAKWAGRSWPISKFLVGSLGLSEEITSSNWSPLWATTELKPAINPLLRNHWWACDQLNGECNSHVFYPQNCPLPLPWPLPHGELCCWKHRPVSWNLQQELIWILLRNWLLVKSSCLVEGWWATHAVLSKWAQRLDYGTVSWHECWAFCHLLYLFPLFQALVLYV